MILSYSYKDRDNCYPAPAIWEVQEWLRTTKNLVVNPYPIIDMDNRLTGEWEYDLYVGGVYRYFNQESRSTPREAISDGINECIKLLKKDKEK